MVAHGSLRSPGLGAGIPCPGLPRSGRAAQATGPPHRGSDKIAPMHDNNPPRRDILGALIGASLLPAVSSAGQTAHNGVPYRTLGRTGERVSAIGLGGYHIGVPKDEADGIKLIRTAVDEGINFLDNCWDYHDGKSEVWMGKALRDGYRQKVFLMTKFDGRTKEIDGAADRRIADAAADGPRGPDAVSREHTHGRSGPVLRAGWSARSAAGGEEGGQDPVHRLHRAQGSGRAPAHAGSGAGSTSSISMRRRCR